MAQDAVRKVLERLFQMPAARHRGQLHNEERWRFPVRVEVKSGSRDVDPVVARHDAMAAQSSSSKSIGDPRPFVGVVFDLDLRDGVAMIRVSALEAFCAAVVERAMDELKARFAGELAGGGGRGR